MDISRRGVITLASAAVAGGLAGCGAPTAAHRKPAEGTASGAGGVPERPSGPIVLNVLDVAGDLQLTRGIIDAFVARNPTMVSRVTYSKAPSPDLVGKIKAQQDAGRVDIALVLTGLDGLAAGTQQGLWQPLLPDHAARLGNMSGYQEPAARMQELSTGHGVVIAYSPGGPLLEYLPSTVPTPPTSADELLAYARAHPGTVEYARPASSGPGRTLLMGLPYVLGDSDPKDPVNGWAKTWAYLTELDRYVRSYRGSTSQTMKDLANGAVHVVATGTGWTINPIVLGTVPAQARVTTLKGFHWVTDAHYAVIPRGASPDAQATVLHLIQFMLTEEQQATTYDDGYFYPGPAIRGLDLSMAPAKSREALRKFPHDQLDTLIRSAPQETPLATTALVTAFDLWDRRIGGSKVKK